MPRDIDPKVNDVENCYLYTVDDLNGVVATNLEQRKVEAAKAEAIVEQEIGQFFKWLSSLDVTPTIVALRTRFDEIRKAELAKTLSNWKDLPPGADKKMDALTNAIMNKLLHHPTSLLKRTDQGSRNDLYVDALRHLFDLETGEEQEAMMELED